MRVGAFHDLRQQIRAEQAKYDRQLIILVVVALLMFVGMLALMWSDDWEQGQQASEARHERDMLLGAMYGMGYSCGIEGTHVHCYGVFATVPPENQELDPKAPKI